MIRSGFRGLLFAVMLVWIGPVVAQPGGPARPPIEEVVRTFARALPQAHLSRRPLDAQIAERAWELYFSELDRNRYYFLAEDIAHFTEARAGLHMRLSEGDAAFAFEVVEVMRARVSNRVAFVRAILEMPLDFDTPETHVGDRKDAPWPAGQVEWDRLWVAQLKSEILALKFNASEEAEKKAKEKADEKAEVPDGAGSNPPAPDAALTAPEVAPEGVSTGVVTGVVTGVEAENGAPAEAAGSLARDDWREGIRTRYGQLQESIDRIDEDWVLERYLTAFCKAYDPHGAYMPMDEADNFNIAMSLSLVGIGAVLALDGDAVKITRIMPGGPADRDAREQRLLEGDRIVAVGQDEEAAVDIRHMPLNKVVQLIRGQKGTRVVLTVSAVGDPTGLKTRTVDLIRDEIRMEDQAAKHEVRPTSDGLGRVGIIRLPSFYGDVRPDREGERSGSARDVANILAQLRTNAVAGILIDLRGNGGGSLREVADMTGLFIPGGPVVFVQSAEGVSSIPDTDPGVMYGGPIVVLVDRRTASASEILAGALQDYERALIVGDSKTFGKGTVQTVSPLEQRPELGTLRVTTAIYYRVLGVSTQIKGVRPDIQISSVFDCLEVGEEYQPYAFEWRMITPPRLPRYGSLRRVVGELERRSLERRGDDARFERFAEVLANACAFYNDKRIPLDTEGFRLRMEQRRELERRQAEFAGGEAVAEADADGEGEDGADADADGKADDGVGAGGGEGDGVGEEAKDLVLAEGLRILEDIMGLHTGKAWPEAVVASEPGTEAARVRDRMMRLVEELLSADAHRQGDAATRLRLMRPEDVPAFVRLLETLSPELRLQVKTVLERHGWRPDR